ncbi:GntR family transcriptional regulator [Micromonospora aurantiaca]|uniref:GntR family transcriptional regulator n=1 Tax=Micromonospora aurantiaca (nom. illeg.) TaxID=47850 RepID=UPI003452C8E9
MSNQRFWLALGKTSARYGKQVPTPHYRQPRYRAIADALRERIEGGIIPPGGLLPAESVLTAEFRASRGTIRQAIAVLRDEGVVITQHGRGTYADPRQQGWDPTDDTEPEARQRRIIADRELAELFAVEVGTTLIERESVTRSDGVVHLVVRAYRLPRIE